MAAGDLKRSTSGVLLPAQVSSEIWSTTQEQSAVMAVSRQISLPGSGVSIPIITGLATPLRPRPGCLIWLSTILTSTVSMRVATHATCRRGD